MSGFHALLLYLGLINLAAFALFGVDKRLAVRGLRRVPERTLLWAAGLGGSVGALAGMLLFHHKTRKRRFAWGVPALLAAHILLALLVIRFGAG